MQKEQRRSLDDFIPGIWQVGRAMDFDVRCDVGPASDQAIALGVTAILVNRGRAELEATSRWK